MKICFFLFAFVVGLIFESAVMLEFLKCRYSAGKLPEL